MAVDGFELRPLNSEAMMHDPGNDLEAAVNVQVGNLLTQMKPCAAVPE